MSDATQGRSVSGAEADDAQDPREQYVAPALTDLGSFQELTGLNSGEGTDLEAFS